MQLKKNIWCEFSPEHPKPIQSPEPLMATEEILWSEILEEKHSDSQSNVTLDKNSLSFFFFSHLSEWIRLNSGSSCRWKTPDAKPVTRMCVCLW